VADVNLENVTKLYAGDVKAVDNLSLAIRDAEFVVLVGPSGCGKSTTLRMVSGLEDISTGTIRIGGRVVNDVPPKDRDVAMVFQNYALYPHMSVYKNMAFGLKLRGVAKREIDEKVRSVAKMLDIELLLARKPKALSGGQRQRVALGRAIVRTPQAFLFDEPLSNLDAKLRVETRAELRKLHRRLATTTIYVTHDQEEAMTLGDRVAVMKDGRLHQCAGPLEIYERPVNRFVAGFMGTPPMNFLEGRLFAEGEQLYFDEGSNKLRLPEHLKRALGGRVGQRLVLGVRPECLAHTGQGKFAGEDNILQATINAVEPLGDRMDLHASTSSHEHIVCRVEADRGLSDGTRLALHLNMSQVHVFEPGAEGVNIGLSCAGDQASAA
jgi:multiple sugar transport system ATP-binding protein